MKTLWRKRNWRRLATLCVIGTALVGLGIGISLNILWARYVPQEEKSVSRLVKELKKQDSAFDLAVKAMWPKLPAIIKDRFLSWKPIAAVEIRRAAAGWLVGSSDKAALAVPALSRALNDSDLSVRISAIKALEAVGPAAHAALPELTRFFENEQNDPIGKSTVVPRGSAALAIASIGRGHTRSVKILTRGLERELGKERTSLVAPFIVRALGRIGTERNEAVPVLIRNSSKSDNNLKVSITNSLGPLEVKREAIVHTLIRVLKSRSPVIRLAAIIALGNVGAESAPSVPALLRLFQKTLLTETATNADRRTPRIAFTPPGQTPGVFVRVGTSNVPRFGRADRVEMDTDAVWRPDFQVTPGMNPAKAENAMILRILVTLGKIGPGAQEATEPLARYYRNSSSRFRYRAVRIRWEIDHKTEPVIPFFLEGLTETEPRRRLEVITLLDGMGKPAFPVLQEGAQDSDERVRKASISRAYEAGAEALPLILEALEDPSKAVRVVGLNELADLGSAALPFVGRVVPLLNDTKTIVQLTAEKALNKIDPSGSSKWKGAFRERYAW